MFYTKSKQILPLHNCLLLKISGFMSTCLLSVHSAFFRLVTDTTSGRIARMSKYISGNLLMPSLSSFMSVSFFGPVSLCHFLFVLRVTAYLHTSRQIIRLSLSATSLKQFSFLFPISRLSRFPFVLHKPTLRTLSRPRIATIG